MHSYCEKHVGKIYGECNVSAENSVLHAFAGQDLTACNLLTHAVK